MRERFIKYVKLTPRGRVYSSDCPVCKDIGSVIFHDDGTWVCMTCGKKGKEEDYLAEVRGIPVQKARCLLEGIPYVKETNSDVNSPENSLILRANGIAQKYYSAKLFSKEGETALSYFKKRGLSTTTIRKLNLGFADGHLLEELKKNGFSDKELIECRLVRKSERFGENYDFFRNRVIFPILNEAGQTVGFGGRAMDDSKPKYINSPESGVFEKRSLLYGLYAPGAYKAGSPFVLCEGYMDVISMYQAGVRNAVATLGTALTPDHAKLIRSYTDNVLLCYDSDEPGTKAAERAVPILEEEGISSGVVSFRPAKDPDEFTKKYGASELIKRFDRRENSFLFSVRQSARQFDFKKDDQKGAFVENVARKILTEKRNRNIYVREISRIYQIPEEVFWTVIEYLE